jgi:ketosteroid isomerase-like protein
MGANADVVRSAWEALGRGDMEHMASAFDDSAEIVLPESGARAPTDRVHRAGRQRAAEQLADQLDRVAARHAVADRQRRHGGLQPRAERPAGNAGRQLSARGGAAVRAAPTM